MLTELLSGWEGVKPAPVTPGGYHVFWAYPLFLEDMCVGDFLNKMKANHIPAGKHMAMPVYFQAASLQQSEITTDAGHAHDGKACPKAESLHNHLAILWINENWEEKQIQHAAKIIKMSVKHR